MDAIGSKHRIGGYRIIAPIGVGSSSTVFRALDEASGSEVAIKVLADNHSQLPEMRHRFVDEVELLSSIRSPAIAKIYKVGETENHQPFMVLELADRGNLRRRIDDLRRDGSLVTQSDLLLLAEHLATALGTLHAAGIVHRDVSPGNVLIKSGLPTVTRTTTSPKAGDSHSLPSRSSFNNSSLSDNSLLRKDERFLVIDLGFAKDLQYASGLTAGGGTRGFAAPEQRDDITMVDHRADIYSATALLEWVAAASDISRSAKAEQFEAFVEIGLADDQDDRFDSIDEWFTAAREALKSPSTPVGTKTVTMATVPFKNKAAPRMPAVAIVAAFVGVAAVVGLTIGLVVNSRDSNDEVAAELTEAEEPNVGDADGEPDPLSPVDSGESDPSNGQSNNDEPTSQDSNARDDVAIVDADSVGALPTSVPLNDSTGSESSIPTSVTAESTQSPKSSTTATTKETSTLSGSDTTALPTTPDVTTTKPTATTRRTTSRPTTTERSTTQRTTSRPSTTQRPTTSQRPTSTLAPTTTISLYRNSPRAYISSPRSGANVGGNLTMSGTATYPLGGVKEVQITIMSEETGKYFHDSSSSFQTSWIRFPVSVSPAGGRDVTWSYTVDGSALAPGRYQLRVWAQSTSVNGDPVSDRRSITVLD